jgi:hypothetical protein
MKKIVMMLSIICCSWLNVEGLILSGVDTISYSHEFGFDFINQQACTTFTYNSSYGCYNHFSFFYNSGIGQFELGVEYGYGIQAGKVNLDSIKTAPPDSSFKLSLHVDSIPQDSLSSYVGDSYIIKTGADPRDGWIYFAKIRILGFRVIDSANHQVEMRFLWACNDLAPIRDLTTSGLDTFNLSTTILSQGSSPFRNISPNNVFKVVGDRFVIPKEFVGTGAYLTVYDLTGKKLGSVAVGNKAQVDLSSVRGSRGGVMVVRVERRGIIIYNDE